MQAESLTLELGKGRFSSAARLSRISDLRDEFNVSVSLARSNPILRTEVFPATSVTAGIAGARSSNLTLSIANHPGRNSTLPRRKKSNRRKETGQFKPVQSLRQLLWPLPSSQPLPFDETRYPRSGSPLDTAPNFCSVTPSTQPTSLLYFLPANNNQNCTVGRLLITLIHVCLPSNKRLWSTGYTE